MHSDSVDSALVKFTQFIDLDFMQPISEPHSVGYNAARLTCCRNRSLTYMWTFGKKLKANLSVKFLIHFCYENYDLNARKYVTVSSSAFQHIYYVACLLLWYHSHCWLQEVNNGHFSKLIWQNVCRDILCTVQPLEICLPLQYQNCIIPHPPWPLLISDVGLELEGTLINCSLL